MDSEKKSIPTTDTLLIFNVVFIFMFRLLLHSYSHTHTCTHAHMHATHTHSHIHTHTHNIHARTAFLSAAAAGTFKSCNMWPRTVQTWQGVREPPWQCRWVVGTIGGARGGGQWN